MLMEVKNNIKFFFKAVHVSILSAFEYKLSFVIQSLFMILNNASFLLFWGVVLGATGDNHAVYYNDIMFLWSIPVIAYGVTYFFFGGVININTYIITGQMDSYLLQPKNLLVNVLTSKCDFSAFGDLLFGLIVGFLAVHCDIFQFIILVILGIFGSVFHIACEIIFRALSAWVSDTENIATTYNNTLLTTFTCYPEQIFGKITKVILYTIVPSAYMAYIPKNIITNFNIKYVVIFIVAVIVYFLLARFVFYKAMARYESGNSISMKM